MAELIIEMSDRNTLYKTSYLAIKYRLSQLILRELSVWAAVCVVYAFSYILRSERVCTAT
jgi:hypothetical protein